jgi:hypothetical protein
VTPDRREFPKASIEFLERRLADLDRLALAGDGAAAICAEAIRQVLNRLAAQVAARIDDQLSYTRRR